MIGPKQEKRFEYKGVPCVIFFQTMGFRTGYIGLPEEVNVYEDSVECHCGITDIENHLYYQDDIYSCLGSQNLQQVKPG